MGFESVEYEAVNASQEVVSTDWSMISLCSKAVRAHEDMMAPREGLSWKLTRAQTREDADCPRCAAYLT